jgi:hypothetical protein
LSSRAAFDAPLLLEWDDPAAGTVSSCELVWTRLDSEAAPHGLRFCLDSCANELSLDPDEDRPKVKASQHLLVGGRDVGVSDWAGTGHDPTNQRSHGGRFLDLPYRSDI